MNDSFFFFSPYKWVKMKYNRIERLVDNVDNEPPTETEHAATLGQCWEDYFRMMSDYTHKLPCWKQKTNKEKGKQNDEAKQWKRKGKKIVALQLL